ncbi:SDR family NAD(P)-dependent oxidoreductase [Pseudoruegeria sp. SHC-113]|uniref:SDR family NAD(P)-dependent oxidoreductase n=1 Tax=Pseudoruegeria sp. SHC-113 TaxID=2855439 RepID=UPI0021BACD88|nr:SDR family NAD(P)-dependent oxidoreductase [Pseudoruegeria sp. SHC-113]MCT8160041.1 SDR family NAD(P)-dependent oxidoreductase [Pseudoruegeria sp. SHC-113]
MSKRTAIITGGAGGLGRALDEALRARGWATVLVDLPGPALDALPDLPDRRALGCDLTDGAALEALCAGLRESCESIDLVIYNAGVTQITLMADTEEAAHRKVFDINYFAATNMARLLCADLRAAKGTHLAVSSVAGFAPLYSRTAYAASKHAVEGFFKSLRSEERGHGVRVAIAAPSFVATNIGNPEPQAGGISRPGAATDGMDYMPPDAAAEVILKGFEKGRDFIPVGRIARLAYGLNRLSPALYQRLMERNINGGEAGS